MPPSLFIRAYLSEPVESGFWDEPTMGSDPMAGLPYRWRVMLTTYDQIHNSPDTPTPYCYNGLDIRVGDWFAAGVGGRANRIIAIEDQQPGHLIAEVEDDLRYNVTSDPNQESNGLAGTGSGFIFRLGTDGLPVLGPQSGDLPKETADDLMARFMARNGIRDYVLVRQPSHGMKIGDVIYADFVLGAGYQKVNRENFDRAIGLVTEINRPGTNYFSYRPLGRMIQGVNPPLTGKHGDVFYLDPQNAGLLTNQKPQGLAVPIYLQLEPTTAILLERGVSVDQPQSESETNKYDVKNVALGQTLFVMPGDCQEVLYMAVNGIENKNFTFDQETKALVFDPQATGYGVETDDEIFFVYKT